MKTYNLNYTNIEDFTQQIKDNSIVDNEKLLIQIFTSYSDEILISKMLDEINSILPSSTIIGATTDGEICEGNVSTGTTVVSLSQFKNTKIKSTIIQGYESSKQLGIELAKELCVNDAKVIITFSDGLSNDGEEFLNGINKINDSIIVSGGMAGDNAAFVKTYVFSNNKITANGAVGVSLINQNLQINTDYSFNWLPIGKSMEVTKVEKNRVYTVDNISTYDVYKKYFGEDVAKGLPAIGIEYPLIINRGENSIARAVVAKHDDGSLSFAGDFKVGDKVNIGYGDAEMVLRHSIKAQYEMRSKPIESIFIYSCMARRRFMPKFIDNEIKPFTKLANVSGFFTYGEFYFLGDKNELLNQTMTILALSESSKRNNISLKKAKNNIKLDEYQKSMKALSNLLSITTKELSDENKRLEKKTKEVQVREESLTLAQEIGHFGSWEIDLKTQKAIWSKESYKIYKEDVNIKPTLNTFLDRIIPQDKQKAQDAIALLKDGRIHSAEFRAKRNDGVIINVLLNAKMIFDDDNTPIKMVGTTLDITEQLKAKLKDIKQSQILEQIHDSVVSTDLDGIITYWNNGAYLMHGYTKEEMIGKSIRKLYQKEDLQKVQAMKNKVLKDGFYSGEIKKITKYGNIIYTDVSLSLLKDENQNIVGITRYSQDITQKKKGEEEIDKQNKLIYFQENYDDLTKLPNRNLFNTKLNQAIEFAQTTNDRFALFVMDLDNFKNINDTFGHEHGDEVLKLTTNRLLSCVRARGSLSRLGGDEFAIIVNQSDGSQTISDVAEKIIDLMKEKITINDQDIYASISIGISMFPEDSTNKEELLKYADSAMYKAKDEGRSNYQFYASDLTTVAFEKMVLESSMREAIDKKQFIVYYQPQTDARGDKLVGVEALVRWRHPTMGIIPPDKFIPLAEETGIIIPLDRYVMEQAMSDFKKWYDSGLNPGTLALNLSVKQLNSPDFLDVLTITMIKTGFDVKWLELEITESQMMMNPQKSIESLKAISEMGIEIAIDDFGTGYSSLAYLKRLPVDKLKIDQSFVRDLPYDDEDCAISKAVIALANSLNLRIIAEGVENQSQKEFLLENGCFNIQGYLYSRPIPRDDMTKYLKRGT